jgi:hypothetical protein
LPFVLKIRDRFRRRERGGSSGSLGADEIVSRPPQAAVAVAATRGHVIDLTDVVTTSDGGSAPGARALAADPSTNGHAASNGDGVAPVESPSSPVAMAADLIADYAALTGDLQLQIDTAKQRSSAALHRATALFEALVAAAEVRAGEIREASVRQQLDAQERLGIAIEIVERARAQADELLDLARSVAAQITVAADLDRDAAAQALAALNREHEELVDGARETMRMATDDLTKRLADLDDQLEVQASALLRTGSAERNRLAPVDEIDRRLALAVERALSEV